MPLNRLFGVACVIIVACARTTTPATQTTPGVAASVDSAGGHCPASEQKYFEFQVEREAVLLATDVVPRPTRQASDANLVQFVVDTAGRPDLDTFMVLRAQDTALVEAARRAVPKWRFRPATIGTRKVCQLVQTPVAR